MTCNPLKKQIMFFICAAILAASASSCALGSFVSYKTSPDYPRNKKETLKLNGLQNKVEVIFDEAGVPHIDAKSEKDLLIAIGFVHARYRFFQMDMLRRIARGRVSELVGEQPLLDSTTIKFDSAMRGWGFDKACLEDEAGLTGELKELMLAYTDGVNQAVALYKPLEYRLLGAEPEKWEVADSFALGRLNSWGITHNWNQELARFLLALFVGYERAEAVYPSEPWIGGVSVQLKGESKKLPPSVVDEIKELFPARPVSDLKGGAASLENIDFALMAASASNAWAVGGGSAKNGKPLLASDPHLNHFLPSMVIQQHIKCPQYESVGVTMPGLPFNLFGHTDKIAWGITSAVGDAIDFYAEKVNPDNAEQVLTPDGYKDLLKEEIVIKARDGGSFVEKKFVHRRSRNGVIINDLYPDMFPSWAPPLALHWDTSDAKGSLESFRKVASAKNAFEMRKIFSGMTTPINVYTAADVEGNIAVFSTGRLPVRKHHRGTFPVPGWLDKYQWTEFASPEQTPFEAAEGKSYLAHANNLIWDAEKAPFIFHVDSAPSYRFDRIMELLKSRDAHDFDSFKEIQTDVKLLRGRRLAPKMIKAVETTGGLNEIESKAFELLKKWDYFSKADSAATSIFFSTYLEAAKLALADEAGASAVTFLLSQRYSTAMADLWYDDENAAAWDDRRTEKKETMSEVVSTAFKKAVKKLSDEFGKEPKDWVWGKLHKLQFKHFMGGKSVLASTVNLEENPMGGGMDSVWKSHFDLGSAAHPFKAMAGPVFRMIVDMSDPSRALWIIDTGVSGWPLDPHYGDQHKKWVKGEMIPMLTDWETIKKSSEGTLTFEP